MIAASVAVAVFSLAAWDVARRYIASRSADAHVAINARVDKLERDHDERIKDLHNKLAQVANRQATRKLTGLAIPR